MTQLTDAPNNASITDTNPLTEAPTQAPIEDDGELLSFFEGKPRPWRDTTELLRLTYYGRAIAGRGVAIPFAIHVDPDQIDWRDPLTKIRKKLAYHLAGRRFYAVAEFGADGTVHFQGHVEATDAGELDEIAAALHRVSKGWREGRGKPRAVWAKVDSRVDGWAGVYNCKALEETKAEFDRRRRQLEIVSKRAPVITICSDDLRRDSEALYEADRRRLGARRWSWSRLSSQIGKSPAPRQRPQITPCELPGRLSSPAVTPDTTSSFRCPSAYPDAVSARSPRASLSRDL